MDSQAPCSFFNIIVTYMSIILRFTEFRGLGLKVTGKCLKIDWQSFRLHWNSKNFVPILDFFQNPNLCPYIHFNICRCTYLKVFATSIFTSFRYGIFLDRLIFLVTILIRNKYSVGVGHWYLWSTLRYSKFCVLIIF